MPDRMSIKELLGMKKRGKPIKDMAKTKDVNPNDRYYFKWRLVDGSIKRATGNRIADLKDKIHLHTGDGYFIIAKDAIIESRERK